MLFQNSTSWPSCQWGGPCFGGQNSSMFCLVPHIALESVAAIMKCSVLLWIRADITGIKCIFVSWLYQSVKMCQASTRLRIQLELWISTPQYNSADWLYEGSKGLGANLFKWTVALEVKELDTARHVASAVCTCGVAPEDGTSVPPMSYAASHNTCGVGPALAQGRHPQGSLTETKTYVLRPYHSQSHDGFGTLL